MKEAEYVFRQTSRERAINARGDKHKKRGSGHYVRLPSDNMTRKEKNAMNGKCVSINLNEPTTWDEFREWPTDIQAEYIKKLEATYRVTSPLIAKMMGVSDIYFREYRRTKGFPSARGGFRNPDLDAWEKFLNKPVTEVKKEPEKEEDDDSFWRVECLLRSLVGTGAKITIEVTL